RQKGATLLLGSRAGKQIQALVGSRFFQPVTPTLTPLLALERWCSTRGTPTPLLALQRCYSIQPPPTTRPSVRVRCLIMTRAATAPRSSTRRLAVRRSKLTLTAPRTRPLVF